MLRDIREISQIKPDYTDYLSKRIFDILLALFGLIFFFPFFILFSLLIWYEDKGCILYNQTKVGKDKENFQMLKFRSMKLGSAEIPASNIKKEDPRIQVTKIGRFLRATAMDELPQLINILKGDMSFVGPRPLMPSEVSLLDPETFYVRSSIRPGLTGLAQVCADKYITLSEKMKYDLEYIKNQSLWLDIKIIIYSIIITSAGKWEKRGGRCEKYKLIL